MIKVKLPEDYKQAIKKAKPDQVPSIFKNSYVKAYDYICKQKILLTTQILTICIIDIIWLLIAKANQSFTIQVYGAIFAIIACIVIIFKGKKLDSLIEVCKSEDFLFGFVNETINAIEESNETKIDKEEREKIINKCREILHEACNN